MGSVEALRVNCHCGVTRQPGAGVQFKPSATGQTLSRAVSQGGASVLVKALQDYKAGNRSHPTMRAIAAGLSDQDMADLAAYYASASMKSAAK